MAQVRATGKLYDVVFLGDPATGNAVTPAGSPSASGPAATTLVNGATATGASPQIQPTTSFRSIHGYISAGSGTRAAGVMVYGSNVSGRQGVFLGQINVTDTVDDGIVTNAPYLFLTGVVSSISGTGAAVTCVMGN